MVEVLHLPDPVSTVRERLGADAEPLLAEGEALSMDEAVALAMAIPSARVAVRESDGPG
jgi:hypothetical protein